MTAAPESLLSQPVHGIAAAVRAGDVTAEALAQASLACIERTDGAVNAFTDVTADRALAAARVLDGRLRDGDASARALPLLGVPYAVKNLFDVQGLTTRAGSRIERDRPPADRDGPLVPLVRERLIKVDLDAGRMTLDWHRDD